MATICSVVSRASFFRSRHCLSLSLSGAPYYRAYFSFCVLIYSFFQQPNKTRKKNRGEEEIFFRRFLFNYKRMLLKLLTILIIRYFSNEKSHQMFDEFLSFLFLACVVNGLMMNCFCCLVAAELIKHNERL